MMISKRSRKFIRNDFGNFEVDTNEIKYAMKLSKSQFIIC